MSNTTTKTMAKIKHNNFIDTVNEVISGAKREGVLHLYAEDEYLSGRTLKIKGKQMRHFGTTGYLGLEQDSRIKEAAIAAIQNYGTQFPLSKTYISNPLYNELESKIEAMYGITPVITKNSTLGHLAVIPTVIRDEDGVILDHQVHWSVQNACQQLKLRGIPVEMIRHNNMNMLEDKIKELSNTCIKIWYMADGVYSMFGDYAPMPELIALTKKYPQLHLYFDDVHGMSWKGEKGTGYVFDSFNELPDNVLIFGTLSKTFGASGASLICSDSKLREKIKNFGGPLTFSAQLEPASLASAIASANIHLSPEIDILQKDLKDRIDYFNALLNKTTIPLITKNDSPVFFIGTGKPMTAYNLTQRLFNEGFFVNPGLYPAVPVKNTGIRITVSRHNKKEDIKALAEALEYHFPKATEETDNSVQKIERTFGINNSKISSKIETKETEMQLQYETSIVNINKKTWNDILGKQSVFDWEGMRYLESAFGNAEFPENKWDFHYYVIKDQNNTNILSTFFTYGFWKDDMLASESVSKQLEEKRKDKPMYHTSKVLSMGSLFTEGNHCYINNQHPLAEKAVRLLLTEIEELYQNLNADMLVIRDFEENNPWNDLFHNHGFIKINMPESCVINNNDWDSVDEFAGRLSTRSRKHFAKEIMLYEPYFDVVVKENLSDSEMDKGYELYSNVKNNNLGINTFLYPIEVFQKMNRNLQWEFITFYLKEEVRTANPQMIGIMFCYKNLGQTYVPVLIGMDYAYVQKFHLYRQMLFQVIKRANKLGCHKVDFGLSASFEKRKLGATIIPKVAYVQARDNFAMEAMSVIQNEIK